MAVAHSIRVQLVPYEQRMRTNRRQTKQRLESGSSRLWLCRDDSRLIRDSLREFLIFGLSRRKQSLMLLGSTDALYTPPVALNLHHSRAVSSRRRFRSCVVRRKFGASRWMMRVRTSACLVLFTSRNGGCKRLCWRLSQHSPRTLSQLTETDSSFRTTDQAHAWICLGG